MRTGESYRKDLADGREVYFLGQRVANVAEEPAFRPAVEWTSSVYDHWYVPEPGATNPLFEPPSSVEQLQARIPMLSKSDYLLDITAECLFTLQTVAARVAHQEPELAERMLAYVDTSRRDDIRMGEAISDSKGDRSKRPADQLDPDSYVRVVDRTSDGVVIRGAKAHITCAANAHEMFVMPTKAMKPDEGDYAITCALPVDTEGVRIVNTSTAPLGPDARHFPVSSRYGMPEALVIFDDVFVPRERVFLDGKPEYASYFAHALGLWNRLDATVLLADQADEMVGLAQLIAEANGTASISHIREKIADMLIHATMIRAGLEAAVLHATPTELGHYSPSELYTNAAKYYGAVGWHLMARHLHDISGAAILTAPTLGDLEHPVVGEAVRKYMTANPAVDGEDRMRLLHLARDLTADAYGGWLAVTALQAGGGLLAQRIVARKHYDMDRAKALALGLLE